jgi:hypothetical protein
MTWLQQYRLRNFLIRHSVERPFVEPEDRTRADTGDYQGLGGARQACAARQALFCSGDGAHRMC